MFAGFLLLFLLFIPLQGLLWQWFDLPRIFFWTDELVTSFVLLLGLLVIFTHNRISKYGAFLLLLMIVFGLTGLISGLINENPMSSTILGTFDYIKNLMIIPFFCFFAIPQRKVQWIYTQLYRFALLACLIAVAQEIGFLAGMPVETVGFFCDKVRFGLLRTSSLLGHPNMFGLYCLLFFLFDVSIHRKIRWQTILLILGMFLSLSRITWMALIVSSLFLILQNQNTKIVKSIASAGLIACLALILAGFITDPEIKSSDYFRGYSLRKSIEIWTDHPLLGRGPGTYGGPVSLVTNSSVYQEYHFLPKWLDFMKEKTGTLDQFWPQILAEMGLLGTSLFLFLILSLRQIPRRASLTRQNLFNKRLLSGLSIYPVILLIFLLSNGLNLPPVLITYSTLLGLSLGSKDDENTFNQ